MKLYEKFDRKVFLPQDVFDHSNNNPINIDKIKTTTNNNHNKTQ